MHRLPAKYKELPTDKLNDYKWYVAFVGNLRHVVAADIILSGENMEYHIWAPCFQEYRKYHSDFIMVDRLLYAGYIFLGLKNQKEFVGANISMLASRKGYLLGTSNTNLKPEELASVHSMSSKFVDSPRMMFNVKAGDNISIKSGILSGLSGKVKEVKTDGRLLIQAFFMGRDVEISLSILDIQSLGESNFYEDDTVFDR